MAPARPLASTLRLRWLLLAGVAGIFACRQTVLVALPSKDARWVSDFASKATEHEVTVEAHLHAWQGEPRDLSDRATPVLVRVENRGKVPVRIAPTAFELVGGTARFRTVLPERIAERPARLVTEALPESTLAPGESSSGFLYFPRIAGDWGFLHLRTTLTTPSEVVFGSVDVPFGSGHVERCSLAYVDEGEPYRSTDILFHTCLPPF